MIKKRKIINKFMKKALIIIIITLGVLVLGFFILNRYIYNAKQAPSQDVSINSYEDCAAAGYPILESYPEKCQAPDGRTFTRKLTDEELANMAVPAIMRCVFTCLPHRDTSGPVTQECAYGFQAEDGNYYALKDENRDKGLFDLSIGEEIEIRGLLIPEKSEKYNSQGVIEIQELYVIEEEEEELAEVEREVAGDISYTIPAVTANYMTFSNWQVNVIDDKEILLERVLDDQLVCVETESTSSLSSRVSRIYTSSAEYCLEANSEGAAGSVYTDYSYYTLFDDNLVLIQFTVQYPQCVNYDGNEQEECATERENFNLDDIVDEVRSSIIIDDLEEGADLTNEVEE
jgi:hypothetical protein